MYKQERSASLTIYCHKFRLALADGIEVMKEELVGIDNTNP